MKNIINLEEFRTPKAKIFTGRDRGEQVRKDSKIDEIESKFENVDFIIPANLYSINPSFFEELFINVVKKLGEEKFYAKFNFKNEGTYNYEKPLKEAISRILREKTALDK
ncbi:DUF4325 domain-containing protein [Olleya sp. AS48]|uniref:DUF4325 domain-containing protein n=1 Tax=Olleya sp. AS48 TaxID=3135774 RepID=UPI00317DAA93